MLCGKYADAEDGGGDECGDDATDAGDADEDDADADADSDDEDDDDIDMAGLDLRLVACMWWPCWPWVRPVACVV